MLLNVAFSELKMKKGKVVLTNRGSIVGIFAIRIRTLFYKHRPALVHDRRINEMKNDLKRSVANITLDKITLKEYFEIFISRSTCKIGFFNTLLTASRVELSRLIKKPFIMML